MGLQDQINEDVKAAMRSKDTHRLSALRLLKAAITNLEIARTDARHPQHGQTVTEEDVLGVARHQIKQRRDAIALYQQGNRPELAAKEETEIHTLEGYLPQQLSHEAITAEVTRVIADLGTREFPKVMREAAGRLKGRADGKVVNAVVKELTATP